MGVAGWGVGVGVELPEAVWMFRLAGRGLKQGWSLALGFSSVVFIGLWLVVVQRFADFDPYFPFCDAGRFDGSYGKFPQRMAFAEKPFSMPRHPVRV